MNAKANKKHITLTRLFCVFCLSLALCMLCSNKPVAAKSQTTCIKEAKTKYGEDYVNQYSEAFKRRCQNAKGYLNGTTGSCTYIMLTPDPKSAIPELTGLEATEHTFDLVNVAVSCETSSKDAYVCVESSTSGITFGRETTETAPFNYSSVASNGEKYQIWGKTAKNGWSNMFATKSGSGRTHDLILKVTASELNNRNIGHTTSGLFKADLPYISRLRCSTTAGNNHILVGYYRITNIIKNTPKATYNGKDYADGDTIYADGDTITFTHQIARNDAWNDDEEFTEVYKKTIYTKTSVNGPQTILKSDNSWQNITLEANNVYKSVDDSIDFATLGITNAKIIVCSELTYRKVKGFQGHIASSDSEDNVDKSTICTWVDKRITLTAGSESFVDNGISISQKSEDTDLDSAPVHSGFIGSQGFTTPLYYFFVHKLKLTASTQNNYAKKINYYITQKIDDGPETTTASGGTRGNPLSATINADNNPVSVYASTPTKWEDIAEGKDSPTICQSIHFQPKEIVVGIDGTLAEEPDHTWRKSTICAKLTRHKSTVNELKVKDKVYVDGLPVTDPEKISLSTKETEFTFTFAISNPSNDHTLRTNYYIKRTIYRKVNHSWNKESQESGNSITVTVPPTRNITDTFRIAPILGQSRKVCEQIILSPYRYRIHYDDEGNELPGTEEVVSSPLGVERCAIISWPVQQTLDDGKINIYASSSGTILDSTKAHRHGNTNTYVLTGDRATITYTHTLWREPTEERHVNGNKAQVTDEEVATIYYRLGLRPEELHIVYTAADIRKANLSKEILLSKPQAIKSSGDSIYTNTKTITDDNQAVGQRVPYCQSIYYVSKTNTLQGVYDMADGEIVNPKMREAKNPLSKPVMVGVSTGCIEVVRPYNFNVKEITMQNSPTGDVVYPGGKAPSVKFDIHVTKNTAPEDDHAITGIPNATIQPITIILKEKPEDGTDLHGSSGVEDPCAYIEGKFDETPIVDCNDHSKTITASIVNSSDGNNINEGASEVSAYRNISGYTATYEPNFDNVNGNLPDTYKVCYALAVKATNSGTDGYGIKEADFDTRWTVSDIACVNIGKKPNFQVWGGSVFAEGGIKTSTTRTDYGNFGSWGDYLVIANKRIQKMASGAYYISGSASESNCDISPLTISNVSCQLGSARINSKSYSLIDGIDEYYLKNGTNKYTDIASNALDSESEVHVINLEVMNKANSKYPILIYNSDNANQDIYIKTNISLGFSEREYKDINVPQVIIFSKGNIYIDSDVTRLDAWLLTRGKIYTCATPKSAKNKNDHSARTVNGPDFCNKELVITGPLVAEKIYFDRTGNGDPSTAGDMSQAMIHSYFDTYGTDTETTIARPAEVIDYNPSIYLFGYNETSNDKQPMTTYLHKLPPRY